MGAAPTFPDSNGTDFLSRLNAAFTSAWAAFQNQDATAWTSSGSAPAFAINPAPTISANAAPQRFRWKFHANGVTGSNTGNINGKGALNFKQYDSFGVKVPGVIVAGQLADVENDGTDLVILNPLPSPVNVPVRQTALAGGVDANGSANFLGIGSGLAVSLTATVPVVVAFAAGFGAIGEIDFVGRIATTLAAAWSGLTASSTLYLYVDRNVSTGAITYGFTALAPNYGYGIAKSTVNGQHTYRIDEGVMYVGNGSAANAVQRVFLGECVTGASTVSSVTTYALMGSYDSGWTSTLPGLNVSTAKSHNLGTTEFVPSVEIRCLTAEAGWSVGEITEAHEAGAAVNYSVPTTLVKGRTVVTWQAGGYASVAAMNRTNGGVSSLTPANWAYRVICKRRF